MGELHQVQYLVYCTLSQSSFSFSFILIVCTTNQEQIKNSLLLDPFPYMHDS